MIKRLLLIAIILLFSNLVVKSQVSWQWAKTEGGPRPEIGLKTCVDQLGNLYVTGIFREHTQIGNYVFNAVGATNDIFLAKYDTHGNLIWANSAGGSGDDICTALSCDQSGNVYFTGTSNGTKLFYKSDSINFFGIKNTFVIKLDLNGNYIWGKNANANSCIFNDITIASNNQVYVTGQFTDSTFTFANNPVPNSFTFPFSDSDMFIAAYDQYGNELWIKSPTSYSGDNGWGICTDKNGNILVTGIFGQQMIFDNGFVINNTTTDNAGFFCKFDSTGNLKWAETVYNQGERLQLATDQDDNIYLAGVFYRDSLKIGTFVRYTNASTIFLAKADSAGQMQWISTAATSRGNNRLMDLCADNNNNIYITGTFSDRTISFDSIQITNPSHNYLLRCIYVANYQPNGNALWALNIFADRGIINGNSISCDLNGNVFICGAITDSAYAGTIPLFSAGQSDFFVAAIGSSTTNIHENKNDDDISVYPNPSDGNFEIRFREGIKNYTISDLSGRIISKGLIERKAQLHFSDFNRGVYFISIGDGKSIKVNKFIVCK